MIGRKLEVYLSWPSRFITEGTQVRNLGVGPEAETLEEHYSQSCCHVRVQVLHTVGPAD